jgi:hypothetical protein
MSSGDAYQWSALIAARRRDTGDRYRLTRAGFEPTCQTLIALRKRFTVRRRSGLQFTAPRPVPKP